MSIMLLHTSQLVLLNFSMLEKMSRAEILFMLAIVGIEVYMHVSLYIRVFSVFIF